MVKLKVKVLEAKYVKEADSIILVGESERGSLRHQISSSCFTFGNLDKVKAMTETAELMIGKEINLVFDEELDGKIADHFPLKY